MRSHASMRGGPRRRRRRQIIPICTKFKRTEAGRVTGFYLICGHSMLKTCVYGVLLPSIRPGDMTSVDIVTVDIEWYGGVQRIRAVCLAFGFIDGT